MLYNYKDISPKVHESVFIADSANVIGNVKLEEDASVWFNAVIRGDENNISIDKGANIQDNVTVHVSSFHNVYIGEYVNVGHNAVLHGCTIGKHTLIGMGSVVLDGAEVGESTIVGAGSLVPQGKKIPSGVLCMGSPVKVIRELTEEEIENIKDNARNYIKLAKDYKSNEK